MSYPSVRLVLENVCLEEPKKQTLKHFEDPNYHHFLMVGDLREYDRFIKNARDALQFLSNEPSVVQQREFNWECCYIQILSCISRYHGLVELHAVAAKLATAETDSMIQFRRGFRTVTFPFFICNLQALERAPFRRC